MTNEPKPIKTILLIFLTLVFFIFFKLKNNFFCAVVIPIFTKLQDLNTYSFI